MTSGWVLLHGFTGGPAAWDEVRAPLAARGPVLCPALVGHAADSGQPTGFIAEVDRLAALIAAAGFARSQLCGYSLGARLALALLVRHRALFSRATLIGVHPGLPDAERPARADADERWAQLAESDAAEFLARWSEQPLFATQQALPADHLAARDRLRARHDGRALAAALRALSLARMPDWRPFLPQLTVPVQLIAGALDTKFADLAQQMAAQLPQATLTLVAGTGHNVVLERPEVISAALLQETAGAASLR